MTLSGLTHQPSASVFDNLDPTIDHVSPELLYLMTLFTVLLVTPVFDKTKCSFFLSLEADLSV